VGATLGMARNMARLTPDKCIFLVCDVQERFRSAIHNFPAVVAGSQRMLKAAIELKIPALVTEQYPKGLGKTVEELDVSHAEVFEKTTFTMLCPAVAARLAEHKQVTDFVLVGIEAHVCVQQTTLDLLEQGFNVHLCVDALSSSTPVDRACGLHRAECACAHRLTHTPPSQHADARLGRRAGAYLTTTESVLMDLIRGKDHPSFKAISANLKETKLAEPLGFI
jgi:nicotinamidase-related amidase